jgi:N utilization substance protein B
MAAVDRNVLRLATFELLHTDAPASVVIDEAIELARDFGSERSPAFVNGVLDAIARGREGAGADGAVAAAESER